MARNSDYDMGYEEYKSARTYRDESLPANSGDTYQDTNLEDPLAGAYKNKKEKGSDDNKSDESEETEGTDSEEGAEGFSLESDDKPAKESLFDKFKNAIGGLGSMGSRVKTYVATSFSSVASKYSIPIALLYAGAVITGSTAVVTGLSFFFPGITNSVNAALDSSGILYSDLSNNTEIEEYVRDPRYLAFTIFSDFSSSDITAEYTTRDFDGGSSSNNWDNDRLRINTSGKLSTAEYFDKYYSQKGEGRSFSDECIVGMIADMTGESYVNPMSFEADYVIKDAIKNDTELYNAEFILANTHHRNWDTFTEALFDYYEDQGVPIAEDGYKYTLEVYTSEGKKTEQHYFPGIGLVGFTGELAYRLQNYCDTFEDPYDINGDLHNDAMYTLDGQLSFMLYDSANYNTFKIKTVTSASALNGILTESGGSVSDDQLIDEWMEASYQEAIARYENNMSDNYWWQSTDDRTNFRNDVQDKWESDLDGVVTEVNVPLAVWGTHQRFNYRWRAMTYMSDPAVQKTIHVSGWKHDPGGWDPQRAIRSGFSFNLASEPNFSLDFEGDTYTRRSSNWDYYTYKITGNETPALQFPGPQWADSGYASSTPSCCNTTFEAMIEALDHKAGITVRTPEKYRDNPNLSYKTITAVAEDVRLECMLYDAWGYVQETVEKGISDPTLSNIPSKSDKDIIVEAAWSKEEINEWNSIVYGNTDPVHSNPSFNYDNDSLWIVCYNRERVYMDFLKYYEGPPGPECTCKCSDEVIDGVLYCHCSHCCACDHYNVDKGVHCPECKKRLSKVIAYCEKELHYWRGKRMAIEENQLIPLVERIYRKHKSWICCDNEDSLSQGDFQTLDDDDKLENLALTSKPGWDNNLTVVNKCNIPLQSHFYDDATSASGSPVYKAYSVRGEAAKIRGKEFMEGYLMSGCEIPDNMLDAHISYCDHWAVEQHGYYHELTMYGYGWNWLPNDTSAQGLCKVGCKDFTDAALRNMKTSSAKDDKNGTMQNMTPAEMAVAVAYPKGYPSLGDISSYVLDVDGCYFKNYCTSLYIAVKDIVCPEDYDVLYSSCDRGLATIVRSSGADDNFPLRVTDLGDGSGGVLYQGQLSYCLEYSRNDEPGIRWRRVYDNGKTYSDGTNSPLGPDGTPFNNVSLFEQLEPGDILVKVVEDSDAGATSSPASGGQPNYGAHVLIFVGTDVVQDKWHLLYDYANGAADTAVVHASHMSPDEVTEFGQKDAARGPRCDPSGKFVTDDGNYYVFRAATQNYDSSRCKWNVESLRNYLESLPNGIPNSTISDMFKDKNSLY